MFSFAALRDRISGTRKSNTTGANSAIQAGVFGGRTVLVSGVDPTSVSDYVQYHAGDEFHPGSARFVLESTLELPVKAIWGGGSGANQGLLYPVNRWPVWQPPQVWVNLAVPTAGYGGLQAGAFVQQPLIDDTAQG